ncbi:unnamed protein product [Timema podura]|uniref:DNA mismatch repair protein MutS core domain-containing protein n=1 Tax=Timema podura TaxID=61482 RepID=A0ABN7PRM7_TIMPD|nr:unnamed protein product [Timema podura]
MKQPLRDLNTIVERQEIVGALMDDLEARQALTQEHLRRIPDIQALARRLLKKKVTMQDLYDLPSSEETASIGEMPRHARPICDADQRLG